MSKKKLNYLLFCSIIIILYLFFGIKIIRNNIPKGEEIYEIIKFFYRSVYISVFCLMTIRTVKESDIKNTK